MRLSAWWIILKDKKILLIKRSYYSKAFPWYWTLPSWRWEENETAKQIAIREIKEEIGLDFQPTDLFHTSVIFHTVEKIQTNIFLWFYNWEIKIQEEEVDWYAWYTYQESIELKLAFDYKELIEKLHFDNYI